MKTICIEAKDDGTYSVYDESAQSEQAEGQMVEAPGETEQGAQSAQDIDGALDLARHLLQDDGRSEDEQMQAGYNKGRPVMGKPAGGMTPAKLMGMGG